MAEAQEGRNGRYAHLACLLTQGNAAGNAMADSLQQQNCLNVLLDILTGCQPTQASRRIKMVPKEADKVGFRGCRDEDVFYGQRTDTVNAGRTALSHQCSTEQWQKTYNKNNPTPKADPAMKMASWGQGLLRLEDQELLAPRNTGPAEAARLRK